MATPQSERETKASLDEKHEPREVFVNLAIDNAISSRMATLEEKGTTTCRPSARNCKDVCVNLPLHIAFFDLVPALKFFEAAMWAYTYTTKRSFAEDSLLSDKQLWDTLSDYEYCVFHYVQNKFKLCPLKTIDFVAIWSTGCHFLVAQSDGSFHAWCLRKVAMANSVVRWHLCKSSAIDMRIKVLVHEETIRRNYQLENFGRVKPMQKRRRHSI